MAAPADSGLEQRAEHVELQEMGFSKEAPASAPAARLVVYRDNLLDLAHLETPQLIQEVDSQLKIAQFALLSLGCARPFSIACCVLLHLAC